MTATDAVPAPLDLDEKRPMIAAPGTPVVLTGRCVRRGERADLARDTPDYGSRGHLSPGEARDTPDFGSRGHLSPGETGDHLVAAALQTATQVHPATALTARLADDLTVCDGVEFVLDELPPGPATVHLTWASGDVESMPIEVAAPPTVDLDVPVRTVTITLATYNPDPELFAQQIDSIREQDYTDWACVVVDDGSSPERYAQVQQILSGDDRFVLAPPATNVGFYRNFERALAAVPQGSRFVALSDQDDRWLPHKLSRLVAELEAHPESHLVYHDVLITDGRGTTLASTFTSGHSVHRDDLTHVLAANIVTGWTAMFRRDLLDVALPLPGAGRVAYHDHWLACCAVARGPIGYVEEPLGHYQQHGGNVVGAKDRDWRFWARQTLSVAAGPAMPLATADTRLVGRVSHQARIMLNSAPLEYVNRGAFARALQARGLAETGSWYPARGRVSWLLRTMSRMEPGVDNAVPVLLRLIGSQLAQRSYGAAHRSASIVGSVAGRVSRGTDRT